MGLQWPVNRRIIYNRAAVYQKDFLKSERLQECLLTQKSGLCGTILLGRIQRQRLLPLVTGMADARTAVNDVVDGYGTTGPKAGCLHHARRRRCRLFAREAAGGSLVDGPFPEHWEPKEPPFNYNPMGTSQLISPYAFAYGATYATPGDSTYPIVCTTFRLTEQWHGGGFTRNSPTQGEAQPEPFVEMSEELAAEKGISNGELVTVTSARGSINLKACVTKRWKPFIIDGQTIHEVGIPWHWGWAGMFPGATANYLTPFIGDANTRIPETKVFMVKIETIP